MENRWVLRWNRKTATEDEEVTCWGRLFQTRSAATRKARSSTVDSRVRLTISDEDEVERNRWRALTSATSRQSSSTILCRPVKTRTAHLKAIRSGAFSVIKYSYTKFSRYVASLVTMWRLISINRCPQPTCIVIYKSTHVRAAKIWMRSWIIAQCKVCKQFFLIRTHCWQLHYFGRSSRLIKL